jgi:hypothetical protein
MGMEMLKGATIERENASASTIHIARESRRAPF